MEALSRERAEHNDVLEQSCAVVLELFDWYGYAAEPNYSDDFIDLSSGLAGILYYLYRHNIQINKDVAKGILWSTYAQMGAEDIPNDDLLDKCACMIVQAVCRSPKDVARN